MQNALILLNGAGVAQYSDQTMDLDDRGSVLDRGREGIFHLLHRVYTGSGAYRDSYAMVTGGLFS
jgi:hypothetical protein